jgi:hypothetical protein
MSPTTLTAIRSLTVHRIEVEDSIVKESAAWVGPLDAMVYLTTIIQVRREYFGLTEKKYTSDDIGWHKINVSTIYMLL